MRVVKGWKEEGMEQSREPWDKHAAGRMSGFVFEPMPLLISYTSGGFLSDAGWYFDAEKVMISCYQMCKQTDDAAQWARALECCVRSVSYFSQIFHLER